MGKIGRNTPCPCGSGKKYKKCCLGKDLSNPARAVGAETGPTPALPSTHPDSALDSFRITPYSIAKLFENSEEFAQMQRLQPEKARLFWTPRKVATLSTEDILARLQALTVDASREAYLALAEDRTSAWTISDQWRAAITGTLSRHADDFLGLAACELWKRYCPERPSIEMLDDQMQAGYQLASEGKAAQACESWWAVWQAIDARLRPEMDTTRRAEVVFDGTQSLFNWLPDFALELNNAAMAQGRYAKIGIQLCESVLAHFPGEDELFQLNFRADLGEFHFRAGEPVQGERVLLELIRDYPDRAAGYVRLADLFGYGLTPGSDPIDRERAQALLEQAFARPVVDVADYDLEAQLTEFRAQTHEPQSGSTTTSD